MHPLKPSVAFFLKLGILALELALPIEKAPAQSFNIIYNFTGGLDGGGPDGQLAMDASGSLYIAATGANFGQYSGAADKLKHTPSGWVPQPLYDFNFNSGNGDGALPLGVVLASNGVVFGATSAGGTGYCGNVFQLRPSPTFASTPLAPWDETILYQFPSQQGSRDGCQPSSAPIVGPAGNLYGPTIAGGENNRGAVYELAHSGQSYTEQLIYSFQPDGQNDGHGPSAGLVADSSFTHLYGVTVWGGPLYGCRNYFGCGTVFKLTDTGSGWTETILYTFQGGSDGEFPTIGLALDSLGNLYGAAAGGVGGGGTIFKLTRLGESYTFNVLYSFNGSGGSCGFYSCGALTVDSAGNIYGTTSSLGAQNQGSVFKLSPSGEGYAYTDLHDFTGGADGAYPMGGVIRDASGNLYGTTNGGGTGPCGSYGCGVVWEITP